METITKYIKRCRPKDTKAKTFFVDGMLVCSFDESHYEEKEKREKLVNDLKKIMK